MEHEVYVPFSVDSVRAALADRERVARCVPGLQLDAAEGRTTGIQGRLRVRIGGSTITYRGRLTVSPRGDGFTVKGTGTEARGDGEAEVSLRMVPRRAGDGEGTRLTWSGSARGGGRIADFEDKTVTTAGHRLLDRFAAALTQSIRTDAPAGTADAPAEPHDAAGIGEPDDNERAIPGIPGPEKGEADDAAAKDRPAGPADDAAPDSAPGPDKRSEKNPATEPEAGAEDDPAEDVSADGTSTDATSASAGEPGERGDALEADVFGTDVPPPSLDPRSDELDEYADAVSETEVPEDAEEAESLTAEAAHARRTMIGRSAEEVDHAPPRGRYAPVPTPTASAAADTLRWAAPAAALAVAGAVVLSRILRRRG